jgi:hypothetical protein
MRRRKRFAASLLLALLVVPELRAQDRFWDPARTAGNWNTTTAIWGTSAGGPYTSTWTNGQSPSLDAAPGGSTATLTASITTGEIFFFSGNFTIAADSGGSLSFAEQTIVVNEGASSANNLIINTPILGDPFIQFVNTGTGGGTTGVYLNANNTFSFGIGLLGNTRLGIGTADAAVGPVQSGTLSGDVSLDFTSILSFQSTQTYSHVATGFGDLEVVSPTVGATTLTLTRQHDFNGRVQLSENSTLALANNGTTTSGSIQFASRINLSRNATLDVVGHTGTTWTLSSDQTLVTHGTTTTNGGRILGPARIEGTLDLTGEATTHSGTLRQEGGSLTIAGGATWRPNIKTWAGTIAGADFSQVVGVGGARLDLNAASSSNQITLDIRGESLTGFDASMERSWLIADFSAGNSSGGIVGFSPDKFVIDTASFGQNLNGGSFLLATDANSNLLALRFTPVPEPAVGLGLAAIGLGLAVMARRGLSAWWQRPAAQ